MKPSILALTLLLLVAAALQASAQYFYRDILVSDGPAGTRQIAPQVEIARDATVYVAWTDYRSGSAEVHLASSTDGGFTFAASRPIISAEGIAAGLQRGAQFVIDASGALHFIWQQRNSLGKISARYARSTDRGATFSEPIAVAADSGRYNQDFPSIAVDSSGAVYLAWVDDREIESTGHTQLYFTRSLDGGLTFDVPHRPGTMPDGGGSCECCNTSIAVTPTGDVHISFRSNIDNNRDIWIARSFDRGTTFTLHKAASETWRINACPMTGSSIGVDRLGTAHVVWRDSRPSAGGANRVYHTSLRSYDTICPPDVPLSGSLTNSNYPALGIGRGGRLFCVFQDNSNDPSDIYFTTAPGTGEDFSPAQRLTHEPTTSRQELASVATDANGTMYVAWQDGRNDDGDVMLSLEQPELGVDDRAGSTTGVGSIEIRPNVVTGNRPIEFRYSVAAACDVCISLIDMTGREVSAMQRRAATAGWHHATFDAGELPSGVYTCVVQTAGDRITSPVVVIQ